MAFEPEWLRPLRAREFWHGGNRPVVCCFVVRIFSADGVDDDVDDDDGDDVYS